MSQLPAAWRSHFCREGVANGMTNEPLISIIVPVYGVAPYLRSCIESMMGQTHRNLEIILVDDGSPDECGRICDEYARQDGRIVVIHQENGGVSAARNAGLRAATGAWIGFVDGDDWIEPDMYSYLLERALACRADVVQCGFYMEEGRSSETLFCADEERVIRGSARNFKMSDWKEISNSACNKLYRAACVRDVFYDSAYSMGEDLLYNFHALLGGSGLVLGTRAKYHYVQHEQSACHRPPSLATVRNWRMLLKKRVELFGTHSDGYTYFRLERLRMDMHNCSRMVQFPEMELAPMKDEIRADLRKETGEILVLPGLVVKERIKLLLIGWNWRLYRILLLAAKRNHPA